MSGGDGARILQELVLCLGLGMSVFLWGGEGVKREAGLEAL